MQSTLESFKWHRLPKHVLESDFHFDIEGDPGTLKKRQRLGVTFTIYTKKISNTKTQLQLHVIAILPHVHDFVSSLWTTDSFTEWNLSQSRISSLL